MKPISPFKPHILKAQPFRVGATRTDVGAQEEVEFFKMSSNENMLGPSPKALLAMQRALGQLNEYGFRDNTAFHQALHQHFKSDGIEENQFFIANSGVEVLETICRAFIEPGVECILSSPTFMVYKNLLEAEGGIMIDIPLNKETFALDVDAILDSITDKTRLLFITNPNNPTGTHISKEKIDRLIYNLPAHVIVVYDEVYYHFVEAEDYPRAIDYVKKGRRVIGMHSFSKAYGLAGLRVGYAITTPEIAAYLNRLQRPFMINVLSGVGAIAALGDCEHIEATQKMVREGKRVLYNYFDINGIKYWKSQTNFILISPNMDDKIYTKKMLEKGIMVRPADKFGAIGCVRITIGTEAANQAFMKAMSSVMSFDEIVMAE